MEPLEEAKIRAVQAFIREARIEVELLRIEAPSFSVQERATRVRREISRAQELLVDLFDTEDEKVGEDS
jgi:hypothetical protein